ncbi:MAG: hypothetical protein M3247_07440 [Thermoproteota archaeon]|jgi:hypothetical protein|nr:hypothetical protein [Thermoproteota archaeon]
MSKSSDISNSNLLRLRPAGALTLGIPFAIPAAFTLVGGIATLLAIPFITNISSNAIDNSELQVNGQPPLTTSQQTSLIQGSGSILTISGAILIPLGIASLLVAYGCLREKDGLGLLQLCCRS